MRAKTLISIITVFLMFAVGHFVQAMEVVKFESNINKKKEYDETDPRYPANKDKNFTGSADDFYQSVLKHKAESEENFSYKEFPNATMSRREKILFKDIDKFTYTMMDGKKERVYPNPRTYEILHSAASPDRQVYVFISVEDHQEEFKGSYAVYDVETKQLIAGESGEYLKEE